jgi:hypothetical protein
MKQKLIAFFLVIVMVASALTAAGLATTTTASAATATPTVTTATPTVVAAAIATTTKITASNTNPAPNEPVTFTVTLKAGSTGLSKPVKIWHTLNGVRYADGTHNTVNGAYKFTQAFGSKGQRVYHAEFASDSSYAASAGTVTVNVGTTAPKTPTTLTFGGRHVVNYYDPFGRRIGQEVFATGHLTNKASGKPITGVKVTVEHLVDSTWTYLGSGVTDSTGLYMVRMTEAGDYRAHFLGSTLYAPSWSTVQRMTMPPYR